MYGERIKHSRCTKSVTLFTKLRSLTYLPRPLLYQFLFEVSVNHWNVKLSVSTPWSSVGR